MDITDNREFNVILFSQNRLVVLGKRQFSKLSELLFFLTDRSIDKKFEITI